jgi:nucleotide-binding universal stress UspA family protein
VRAVWHAAVGLKVYLCLSEQLRLHEVIIITHFDDLLMKRQILVPVDMEEMSLYAIEQSINLARLTDSGITLLNVYQPSNMLKNFFSAEDQDRMLESIRTQLDQLAADTSQKYGVEVYAMVKKGNIPRLIVDTAEDINAHFIVMGTYSTENTGDPDSHILGANTSRVIRMATRPVITISRKQQFSGCRSILVPLDLSKETRQKVSKAIELSKLFHSKVHVISAYWSKGDLDIHRRLDHQIKQVLSVLRQAGVECCGEILESDDENRTLVPIILKYADDHEDIDLIMIMTQQEVGIVEFFLGSHAQEMVRKSKVPVMSIVPRDLGERIFIS